MVVIFSGVFVDTELGWATCCSKIVLPTQNGQSLAATLFKPISATSNTPAPFVAVVPDFKDPERHYLISRSNSHEEVLL